ncbi:MAG: amidohydrolase [Mesorhizobium sp.]|uniref:hypothetical protein n=1 Tax=Mesorhizobium TaxID=68287 RepID=UPI000B8545E0|nr:MULTISPECIES: hypothetical protein [Mesorhizobium]MCF6098476.1 hypothetical protein [Mesorhizobium muleiense]RUV30972.1 hypothetical protein EOA86_08690 [Mesorhizobium sp. M5C.F.Ca.IN.020.32.2.1]RWI50736.1 MAG: hypothetical protein EOR16_29890 [Mesorhizobium sp.]RWP12752.1 MAG: hypothetical protein EOR00_26340 [Mesorhizobium sp.]TIV01386.1 MAG: amidohydrolase [Mesorhizobium sp.]
MVRKIHAQPELCFHEQRTSAFVLATARIGCNEVITSFSKAGVVGAVMAAANFDLIGDRASDTKYWQTQPTAEEETYICPMLARAKASWMPPPCGHTAMLMAKRDSLLRPEFCRQRL